ncbi:hypothetical protein QTP88_009244 [Uroleucon formosanum]
MLNPKKPSASRPYHRTQTTHLNLRQSKNWNQLKPILTIGGGLTAQSFNLIQSNIEDRLTPGFYNISCLFVFYHHNSTLRIILSIIVGLQILVLKKRGIDNVVMCILYYPHLEEKYRKNIYCMYNVTCFLVMCITYQHSDSVEKLKTINQKQLAPRLSELRSIPFVGDLVEFYGREGLNIYNVVQILQFERPPINHPLHFLNIVVSIIVNKQ